MAQDIKASSLDIDDETLSILISKLRDSIVPQETLKSKEQCWQSSYKLNGRGHVQIKYKGIKYLGHRIMACARGEGPYVYIKYDLNIKNTASHLCGNPWCINPYHLWLEREDINHTRDCCRMYKSLDDYKCPHIPVCIGCKPCK